MTGPFGHQASPYPAGATRASGRRGLRLAWPEMKAPPEPETSLFQKGPVRAYRDHEAGEIVIETTEGNNAGSGIEICRLSGDRVREAMAIVALPDLIGAGAPFRRSGFW